MSENIVPAPKILHDKITSEIHKKLFDEIKKNPIYDTTSLTEIIETMIKANTLPRVPRKIKMSYNAYQLLQSACDKRWVASIEDERWDGIPIEVDLDLFGYTYELVYEENDNE